MQRNAFATRASVQFAAISTLNDGNHQLHDSLLPSPTLLYASYYTTDALSPPLTHRQPYDTLETWQGKHHPASHWQTGQTADTGLTLECVRRALTLPRPGVAAQARMLPQRPPGSDPPPGSRHERAAAVLILVYPIDAVPHLVLTAPHTTRLQSHKGQISLPGGSHEGNETLIETALARGERRDRREQRQSGRAGYTDAAIRWRQRLFDYAGRWRLHRAGPTSAPNPVEVVEVIEAPLALLLDASIRVEEDWIMRGVTVRIPFFAIGPHKVWGATAMMLSRIRCHARAVLIRCRRERSHHGVTESTEVLWVFLRVICEQVESDRTTESRRARRSFGFPSCHLVTKLKMTSLRKTSEVSKTSEV